MKIGTHVAKQKQIDAGIKSGLADISAGRYKELTPKYGQIVRDRFKSKYKSGV